MNQKMDQARDTADKVTSFITAQLRGRAHDADFLLAFNALLLAGLMGMICAEIGEDGAFELWDIVRRNAKVGMELVKVDDAVRH